MKCSERGDVARARLCLSKAIRADPNDIALRVLHASLYAKLGDCQRAAESYEQISRVCPEDVEVLKISAKLYAECGQTERSISILENYLKGHPSGADFGVIDLLAAVLMETNAHNNALKHIEHAHQVYYSGKEMPLQLKIKAGICHVHLGNIEKSEIIFSDVESESDPNHAGLITDVADAFMSLGHFHAALKYYLMLESNAGIESEGYIQLKIAQCYLSLKDRVKAVTFFYKALHALEDNVDCRLALASLILEDGKEDEAISLLSPPENSDSVNSSSDKQKQWWLDGKIKLKLCHIYRAKGMFEDFVNTIFPLVRESLYVKTLRQKVKKRLTISVLRKRTKILDVGETVDVFGGVRPLASRSDLMKASRARKLLQKREEQKAVARAAGIDWHGDDSEDESLEEEIRVPPLPNFLKDEEHHNLIIDLCKALQSLQRYWEALEIINLTRKLVNKKLPLEKKEELQSIAAQISYKTTDPKHGFDCVKSIVLQHPYSLAAWNCYYKIALRLGKNYSRHAKFLRHMRTKHGDCVPPIVIYGHQFTMASHYQDAVREYLAAYKLLPENPLVNLCVGTAFINLALGFRLQNKHQCVAQGLSFLYNNLRLAENSQVSLQEALYNIACAFHHVGLVSLAASYYEKVLETCERDYPIPKLLNENSDLLENLKPGYCDLRREAAYNLHLIYKKSGAIDLARQGTYKSRGKETEDGSSSNNNNEGSNNRLMEKQKDYYGKRTATASSDHSIKIIGVNNSNNTSQQLAQLTAHEGPVWQEGNQNEWTQAHVFDDHKSSVNSIAWAPHEVGLCLACGSSDGNISVFTARPDGGWDTSRIDQAHPVGVTSVSWAPSTARALQWNLEDGLLSSSSMHTDWVRDVAWAPNLGLPKSTIASASQDGKVIIWTVGKEGDQWEGKVLHDFKTPVWRVSWSLTGNIVAVADGNDNVTLWNEAVDGEWQQLDSCFLPPHHHPKTSQQHNLIKIGRIEADVATDGSGVRFYQQFDHVEYEALAAKKRKGLGDCEGAGSGKKGREDSGASMDEIMEAMNYGIKRKSRKLKKRGRRKSKNKLSPKITKMLGDATVLYAHGRYEEAISVLNEVVRLAPHVPDSYHTLGLVHIALGNTEKAMGFYTIAARLMPKDSPLWRVLFDWHK
ncbi:hypothetical protein GH714_019262 [Hevea brasiliensis]|uniref:Uncharacterized protein n=1 Tax=Hevea brasiliensis TaxID=3981 RepID=A0A6A6MYN3_HEVBR|nr:hypothetical protein GH714_019262 [Hevea brasiliensis]